MATIKNNMKKIILLEKTITDYQYDEQDNPFMEVFPELKESEEESEEERIRKEIIDFIYDKTDTYELREKSNSWLAWLEEQGEQKPYGKTALEAAREEKVDNQNCVNPTDKVEPKFKVGDWVMLDKPVLITKVEDMPYNTHQYWTSDGTWFGDATKAKLWTIQDAKDGDVLSYRNGQWIFIYKEKIDDSSFDYHILYSSIHRDLTINNSAFTLLSDAIIPATKEQRDQLEKAMADAGYKWDAEKKELSQSKVTKISDKDWSEEGEKKLLCICAWIKNYPRIADFKDEMYTVANNYINWLKSLKDRIKLNQK